MRTETWQAPGRVNLIGEHTDYNGGFVLPIAIDRRTTVSATAREDGELRCSSAQFADGGDDSWTAYVRGVHRALVDAGYPVGGADVVVDSDVPVGAGLSSSAALEVASAGALAALAGKEITPDDAAAVAFRAENTFVGVPTGIMDQTVVAKAAADRALFLDCRSLQTELVPFDLAGHGLALAVVDSGVRRQLTDGRYAERRRECEAAAAALGVEQLRDASLGQVVTAGLDDVLRRRARHVVSENARVLQAVQALREGRLTDLGPLLMASHASLRDDFEVSIPELDTIVLTAQFKGAVGARMTGGGFGGAAIVLAPKRAMPGILEAFGDKAFEVQPAGGFGRVSEVR